MNSTRRSFLSCLGAAIGAALAWPLGLKAAAVQGTDMVPLCGLWVSTPIRDGALVYCMDHVVGAWHGIDEPNKWYIEMNPTSTMPPHVAAYVRGDPKRTTYKTMTKVFVGRPRSYIPLEPGTKLVVPKGYEYISPV